MIGDAAYHVSQIKGNMILKALEGYIKNSATRRARCGDSAGGRRRSGVGELGRNVSSSTSISVRASTCLTRS